MASRDPEAALLPQLPRERPQALSFSPQQCGRNHGEAQGGWTVREEPTPIPGLIFFQDVPRRARPQAEHPPAVWTPPQSSLPSRGLHEPRCLSTLPHPAIFVRQPSPPELPLLCRFS